VVAIEADAVCADLIARKSDGVILMIDLENPSPAQGFAGTERSSLAQRGPSDLVLALALLHHLTLGRGLSLRDVIKWIASIARAGVFEFVPLNDPKAKVLVARRGQPNGPYSLEEFEYQLSQTGRIMERETLPVSGRVLFLWEPAAQPDGCEPN
jgi:hypothetical protein